MKRKTKILKVKGFRGLFVTMFAISCLIAGFIAFPGFLIMNIWNYFSSKTISFPSITFYGGVLLWGIIVLSIFITKKKNFSFFIGAPQELTETEVKEVISRLKSQNNSHSIIVAKDIEKSQDDGKIEGDSGELTSVQSSSKED